MKMKSSVTAVCVLLVTLSLGHFIYAVGPTSIPLNSTTWTLIGPAPINPSQTFQSPASGRLAGIAAHPTDPNIIYIAAASGGVWKTTDGGVSWTPLTDTQPTLFMGAIAVSQSNPDIIYAGTGESNNGTFAYYGRGVLKSTDAGATWTVVGQTPFDRRA